MEVPSSKRPGIAGSLTSIWVRERLSGGSAEVVHCHMLFHLAHPFLGRRTRLQVERALERLIDRHGRGNYADHTFKLTIPRDPNGLYLLKGGGPDVWSVFGVPMSWRKRQGLIVGKRCGTTQALRIAVAEACEKGGTKLRALADKLVEQGLAGNVYALREIADRLDGKAIQQHQCDMEERIKLIAVVPQKAASTEDWLKLVEA